MIKNIKIENPDWKEIENLLPISNQMKLCPQDKEHHEEGDVWTHTKMCVESMINDIEWKKLNYKDQCITFYAMLLHDIGKVLTTKEENGRITAKGHSNSGSIDARVWLWKLNVDLEIRESICHIIDNHQLPFYMLKKEDFIFQFRKLSWLNVMDNLLMCAKHDMLGRICKDQKLHLENLEFLKYYIEESNIETNYADNYTRMKYLYSPETISPEYSIYQEKKFEVIMLSGLPGSGKNTYINNHYKHLESISFDEERENLNISSNENGSMAVHKAYDKMKDLLRKEQSFIFNATNLSKSIRQKPLDLFNKYGATVKIIHLEKDYETLLKDDLSRNDKSVGKKVIDQMLFKWQVPTILEAESVDLIQIQSKKIAKNKKF